jgi:anion-transporting  ArsA/GET3 family ATPase
MSGRPRYGRGAGADSLVIVSVRDTDWDGVRLHVVTGKGGTGKTTVAAALALALASNGKPVLLMEVEGRQGIAQLFDVPPLPYEERRVAVAPADGGRPGGDVFALAVDPQSALIEYLEMFYNLRHAGRALTRLGVVDFATTIAPGLSDVLLTGKAAELVRRKHAGVPVYRAVVMDAPPTGRISRFLNVSSEVSGLARVGPIRGHADTVQSVIRSPQTAVHFVTLLEEMPVQETLDGIDELRRVGRGRIQPGGIVVNMMRQAELGSHHAHAHARTLSAKARDTEALEVALKAAGLGDDGELAADLVAELGDEARTARAQRAQRRRLDEAGQPCYELPLITDGIDLAALYRLAGALREQGAA